MKGNKYVVAVLWMEEKELWVLVILLKWNSKSISGSFSKGKFDLAFQGSAKKNKFLFFKFLPGLFSHLDLEILKGGTTQLWAQGHVCHQSHSLLAAECFSIIKIMYGLGFVYKSDTTLVDITFAAQIRKWDNHWACFSGGKKLLFIVSMSGAFKGMCSLSQMILIKKP